MTDFKIADAEELIAQIIKSVPLEHALRRAIDDATDHRNHVADLLRNGHKHQALEAAWEAAAAKKIVAVMRDFASNPDAYRAVAVKLKAARNADSETEMAALKKDEANRARRKHFAEKRQREKATGRA